MICVVDSDLCSLVSVCVVLLMILLVISVGGFVWLICFGSVGCVCVSLVVSVVLNLCKFLKLSVWYICMIVGIDMFVCMVSVFMDCLSDSFGVFRINCVMFCCVGESVDNWLCRVLSRGMENEGMVGLWVVNGN